MLRNVVALIVGRTGLRSSRDKATQQLGEKESLLTDAYIKNQEMAKVAKELSDKLTSTIRILISLLAFS